MAIKFEAPPKKQPPIKQIRVTEETHGQLVSMAEAHKTSITRITGAIVKAHYNNMQAKKV